jgi:hypothetical protein
MEISLVKQGANRKRFKILKEDGAPVLDTEVFMEELPYADVLKADLGTEDSLRETLRKATPDISTDATEVSVALMKLATAYAEELPPDIFETLAKASGFTKAVKKQPLPDGKKVPPEEEEPEDEDEEDQEDEQDQVPQSKKKAKKMATKKADEDIRKSLKSEVRKALDKIEKESDINLLPEDVQGPVRYLFKSNTELESKIEKMEEEKRIKEFIAKADGYTHLPKTDKFYMLLKEMDEKLSPETFEAVEGILKAADAGLKESNLFVEVGSTTAIEGTPEGKLMAMAKDKVTKSDGMTIEQAMAEVTLAHPEIYEEMMRDRGTL